MSRSGGEGWRVVSAHPSHINRIANAMRAADRRECAALGREPKQALRSGLRASTLSWTAFEGGRPMAMFGLAPHDLMDGIGSPWMLAAEGIERGARKFLEWGPNFVEAMQADFPRLENMVCDANPGAKRLIRALGFALDDEVVHIGGVPFRRFSRVRELCASPRHS